MIMTVVHLEDVVLLGAVSLIHVWQCGRSFEIHTDNCTRMSDYVILYVGQPESGFVRFG